MLVYLNGEFLKKENAKISVDDRGFIFGDGIYEVIRVVDGRFFQAGPHMKRTDDGLRGLGIQVEKSRIDAILPAAGELLQKNDLLKGHATVYFQITRGAAPRVHEFPADDVKPNIYMSVGGFEPNLELHEQGARGIAMTDIRWLRCDLKTINLLPNVLAKQKAREAGAFSAIFIRDGFVTEGQNANIFAVKDGVLRTYPLTHYILPGITRALVIEMAAGEGIPVEYKPVREGELAEIDELFLSGTTTDIQPLTQINDQPIGNGKRGPVTQRLQELLYRQMLSEDNPSVLSDKQVF